MAPGNSCVFADTQSNSSNIFLGVFVFSLMVLTWLWWCLPGFSTVNIFSFSFFFFFKLFLYFLSLEGFTRSSPHSEKWGIKLRLLEGENLHELFEILL